MIAIVQPYKQVYMNVIDALTLAVLSLIGALFILYIYLSVEQSEGPFFFLIVLSISFTLPLACFVIIVAVMLMQNRIPNQWKTMFKEKFLSSQERSKQTSAELPKDQRNDGVTTTDLELPELPDRLLHPNRYIGDGDADEN